MAQRTFNATLRTCVHRGINVVTGFLGNSPLKFVFALLYFLFLLTFISTTHAIFSAKQNHSFPEEGLVPQVDIQLEPPKRWKASSNGLEFIKHTLVSYIAKEIAEQKSNLPNMYKSKVKKSEALVDQGGIIKQ